MGFEVPEGWTRHGWAERLRYLAQRCLDSGRATYLRKWASAVELAQPKTESLQPLAQGPEAKDGDQGTPAVTEIQKEGNRKVES